MELLGIKKAGPELGRLLAGVMDWQLAHPAGTLEEAKQHVLTHLAPQMQQ